MSRHVLLFAALQQSQDNKEGGPDMIGLHPTQSGVSDDRDDLNTVEQTYEDDAEHEEILRTFRTCADTDDDLHQRASRLARPLHRLHCTMCRKNGRTGAFLGSLHRLMASHSSKDARSFKRAFGLAGGCVV